MICTPEQQERLLVILQEVLICPSEIFLEDDYGSFPDADKWESRPDLAKVPSRNSNKGWCCGLQRASRRTTSAPPPTWTSGRPDFRNSCKIVAAEAGC